MKVFDVDLRSANEIHFLRQRRPTQSGKRRDATHHLLAVVFQRIVSDFIGRVRIAVAFLAVDLVKISLNFFFFVTDVPDVQVRRMFVLGKPLYHSLMLRGKARSLP
jgi:hypothetical protein